VELFGQVLLEWCGWDVGRLDSSKVEKVRGRQFLGWLEVSLLDTNVDQELVEEAAGDQCIGTKAGGAEEVRPSGTLDVEVEIVVQIERYCRQCSTPWIPLSNK
jgi:hypothetical protein